MKKEIFILLVFIISLFSLNIVFAESCQPNGQSCPDANFFCSFNTCGYGCSDDSDCVAGGYNGFVCITNSCLKSCNEKIDCEDAQKCNNDGVCVTECVGDWNCAQDEKCNINKCEKICNSNSDCGDGVCDNGDCKQCDSNMNLNCDQGYSCNSGHCVNNNLGFGCQQDNDCAQGQTCVNGNCVNNNACQNDWNCFEGESCIEGTCQQQWFFNVDCKKNDDCKNDINKFYYCDVNSGSCVQCLKDINCVNGKVCNAGLCQDNVQAKACKLDVDCQKGQVCDVNKGSCVQCLKDANCLQGYVCKTGACRRIVEPGQQPPVSLGCKLNTDCPQGYNCVNAKCVELVKNPENINNNLVNNDRSGSLSSDSSSLSQGFQSKSSQGDLESSENSVNSRKGFLDSSFSKTKIILLVVGLFFTVGVFAYALRWRIHHTNNPPLTQ